MPDRLTLQPADRAARPATPAVSPASGGSSTARGIFHRGRTTGSSDIGDSLTSKAGGVFALCGKNGDIDSRLNDSDGLYFHDTRFLDRATMRLDPGELRVLLATAAQDRSISELSNTGAVGPDGDRIQRQRLGIRRERVLGRQTVETVDIENFDSETAEVSLRFDFAASFEDMFVIRGADPGRRGTLHEPHWQDDRLVFRYDGADGHRRTTSLLFSPGPDDCDQSGVRFRLCLNHGERASISVTVELSDEADGRAEIEDIPSGSPRFDRVAVTTDNDTLDRCLERSFDDLRMLLTRERGDTFFAAGIPWYAALFGRDSIITALETLAYDPEVAAETLQLLASYQGVKDDPRREEEPGRILHELRTGEKANLGEVPQTPFYGSVDATPLFVILMGEYVRWTGDRSLWRKLRVNVERALDWIDQADHDGDGFVDYESRSEQGLENQGWKDSDNSVRNRDGSMAVAPIALVEVQGYVYRARREAAWLFGLEGERDQAEQQDELARTLRRRFHRAFWMSDRQYPAEALQRGGRQAAVVTSNPGQALWTGILSAEESALVAARLMAPELFNGWGIRTMSAHETAYNPLDYQLGSVWPHDSAIIAAGLHATGYVDEALDLFSGMVDAASLFPLHRLPEVFAGFSRKQFAAPVRYPVACNPQAWAAGALPFMLASLLGLRPDAPAGRLDIVSPALPSWLREVTLHGVRVGDATVSVRYRRTSKATLVKVLDCEGTLEVEVRRRR